MSLELVNSTVVIVAKQFNPSITRDHWLIENGILRPEEFRNGCVFTDVMVQVRSDRFNLFIAPEQLQFTPLVPPVDQQELVEEKIGAIVQTLPHTPYTALGLNFHCRIIPENDTTEHLSRELFFIGGSPIFDEFNTDDAVFGSYLSKNFMDFRLKLDIKPVYVTDEESASSSMIMQFGFNFHLDIPRENSVEIIQNALQSWSVVREESLRIVDLAN